MAASVDLTDRGSTVGAPVLVELPLMRRRVCVHVQDSLLGEKHHFLVPSSVL